jgi:hypothetical protein
MDWERTCLTWWAADKSAGSNAENVEDTGNVLDGVDVAVVDARKDGTLTYGATRHGSRGVVIGGLLWFVNIIPENIKKILWINQRNNNDNPWKSRENAIWNQSLLIDWNESLMNKWTDFIPLYFMEFATLHSFTSFCWFLKN